MDVARILIREPEIGHQRRRGLRHGARGDNRDLSAGFKMMEQIASDIVYMNAGASQLRKP